MFKVDLKLSPASRALIKRMPDLVTPALYKGMKESMLVAEREAKLNLSGRILNRRTGRLRNSITSDVRIAGDKVIGRIGSNVVYARIHELGGEIVPRRAKALKFQIGDKWVTTQKVVMPARPYLRPAIEKNISEIGEILSRHIIEAFEK